MAALSSPIASLCTHVCLVDERASGGVAGLTWSCWGEAGRPFLRGADPHPAAMGFVFRLNPIQPVYLTSYLLFSTAEGL